MVVKHHVPGLGLRPAVGPPAAGSVTAPAIVHPDDLAKHNQARFYSLQAAMAALSRQVSESPAPGARRRTDALATARLPRRAWRGLWKAIPWHRPEAATCRASGWRLHVGCADSEGRAICPVCSQEVDTGPSAIAGRPVRVIRRHPVRDVG